MTLTLTTCICHTSLFRVRKREYVINIQLRFQKTGVMSKEVIYDIYTYLYVVNVSILNERNIYLFVTIQHVAHHMLYCHNLNVLTYTLGGPWNIRTSLRSSKVLRGLSNRWDSHSHLGILMCRDSVITLIHVCAQSGAQT